MDADLSHDPKCLNAWLPQIGIDLVIGSRYIIRD